jgi:uncharacterized protein YcnI
MPPVPPRPVPLFYQSHCWSKLMLRRFNLALLLAGLGAAGAASAHVAALPNEGTAGGTLRTAFNVGHGCDGSSTIAVRLKIPDGVVGVKPQLKPGWEITVKTRKLDPPLRGGHGQTFTETVDEITWRGGPLPDSLYDQFAVAMTLPDRPGQTLYFPVVQECEKGVHRWIDIPAGNQKWDDLREPAPFVRIRPKAP